MKKRVLVIEDEKEMNFRPINRLKDAYEVEIARSVAAAINILKMNPSDFFDLIFLDIMMEPGPYTAAETDEGMESGWVLYQKELRQLPTKIVLWTRNSDILSKFRGSNVVDQLIKSGEDDQLLNAAQKHIG